MFREPADKRERIKEVLQSAVRQSGMPSERYN
jgi:hypothetical protein